MVEWYSPLDNPTKHPCSMPQRASSRLLSTDPSFADQGPAGSPNTVRRPRVHGNSPHTHSPPNAHPQDQVFAPRNLSRCRHTQFLVAGARFFLPGKHSRTALPRAVINFRDKRFEYYDQGSSSNPRNPQGKGSNPAATSAPAPTHSTALLSNRNSMVVSALVFHPMLVPNPPVPDPTHRGHRSSLPPRWGAGQGGGGRTSPQHFPPFNPGLHIDLFVGPLEMCPAYCRVIPDIQHFFRQDFGFFSIAHFTTHFPP